MHVNGPMQTPHRPQLRATSPFWKQGDRKAQSLGLPADLPNQPTCRKGVKTREASQWEIGGECAHLSDPCTRTDTSETVGLSPAKAGGAAVLPAHFGSAPKRYGPRSSGSERRAISPGSRRGSRRAEAGNSFPEAPRPSLGAQ